jgi:FAD-dependent urate hydroxylase
MNAPAGVVVLGAGPYGLAVAAHLRARGVAARVFGDPMSSWRDQMPIGMFLKSTPSASNISAPGRGHTLLDYCHAAGIDPIAGYQPVPVADFIGYGRWFAEQLVPQLEHEKIVRIDRHANGFAVALDSGGELAARAVVLASGFAHFAHVPAELAALERGGPSAQGLVSHSSQHHDLSLLGGRSVAVIGRGQSALETAALLHEHGADVRLLVRAGEVLFGGRPADLSHQGRGTLRNPESPLGPGWSMVVVSNLAMLFRHLRDRSRLRLIGEILGPAGGWWLRERVEGCFPVDLETQIVGAAGEGDGVSLELRRGGGPVSVHVDHVIAATGYQVDLAAIPFLADGLRAEIASIGSWPRLSPSFESSARGLYFVGLAAGATFGPLMRFVCGTPFAARRVAAALAR